MVRDDLVSVRVMEEVEKEEEDVGVVQGNGEGEGLTWLPSLQDESPILDPLLLSVKGYCTFLSDGSHQRIRQAKEKLILQFFSKSLLSSRHSWSTSVAGTSLGVYFLIPCSRCRGSKGV